jgi:hypothetical protein
MVICAAISVVTAMMLRDRTRHDIEEEEEESTPAGTAVARA